MRRALAVTASLVAVLTVAVGAGGLVASARADTKAPPPVTIPGQVSDHGTKTAKHNTIAIEEHNYYFKPTFVQATPGTTLTIKLKNKGNVAHTFTTADGSVDKDLQPGKSATVVVMVPTSGGIVFYCRFHGPNGSQGDSGMQGAVFTQAGVTLTGVPAAGSTSSSAPTTTPTTAKKSTGSGSGSSGGYGY